MDAEAVSKAILELQHLKGHLKDWEERTEKDRLRFRRHMHLESVRLLLEDDREHIIRTKEEIARIEAAIASIPDDVTRKIVTMRSIGKPYAAIVTTVYFCESYCILLYKRACADIAERGILSTERKNPFH